MRSQSRSGKMAQMLSPWSTFCQCADFVQSLFFPCLSFWTCSGPEERQAWWGEGSRVNEPSPLICCSGSISQSVVQCVCVLSCQKDKFSYPKMNLGEVVAFSAYFNMGFKLILTCLYLGKKLSCCSAQLTRILNRIGATIQFSSWVLWSNTM